MYTSDQTNLLRHAIARAFCVVGGWDSPINDDKLRDIDVALSHCSSFKGVSDSDRAAILADADAAIQRDGQDGLGDVNEIIGSEHGPEMVEIMIGLVLSWDANADKKKQLMWHIPPDMGLSLDDYYRMWDRIASGLRTNSTQSNSTLPTWKDWLEDGPDSSGDKPDEVPETSAALSVPPSQVQPPQQSKPPSGKMQNELRLLEQYEEEMRQLTDTLADADPQSSKHIQKKIEQKKLIYWKQITLVQQQWPQAPEGRLHEAMYYDAEALTLLFSAGLMRRMYDRSYNPALKIASGLIAKGQEASNRTKALALIDKALKIVDHPYGRYVKACAYMDQGAKENALFELNHIIKHFGDDDDVYMQARKLKDQIENPPKKSGCIGCFVATAAYGSPLATEVILLSRFRDEVLLHSCPGRAFVACYYRLSPPLAALISRVELLRTATRSLFLTPLLWLMKTAGFRSEGEIAAVKSYERN